MQLQEPRQSENGEIGVIQLTCYDGTIIQIPDDNNEAEHLGGFSVSEIFADPSLLPPACRKFVVYRPPAESWIDRIKRRVAELIGYLIYSRKW